MTPGVYIRENDKSSRQTEIGFGGRRIIVSGPGTGPGGGGGGGDPLIYYVYSTNFANEFQSYPVESGSVSNVWISGSTNPNHNSFFFIKNDLSLWAVGDNDYGQLGIGDTVTTDIIQQVDGGTWKKAAVGMMAGAGITTDGKLYTWGSNARKQLGSGSLVESLTPTWIAQDSTWKDVSIGEYQALGIKTDGTLWSWGTASSFSEPYDGALGILQPMMVPPSYPSYYYDADETPTPSEGFGTYNQRYRWQSGYQMYLGRGGSTDSFISASIKEVAIFTRTLTTEEGKSFRQEMIDRFPLDNGTPTPPESPITPEYWWKADEGLTTSAWSGSNGGVHFELSNVSTANATDGVVFNGTDGFGISSVLGANIDAKHIFIRFDGLVPPTTNVYAFISFMGGTQSPYHDTFGRFDAADNGWYVTEELSNGNYYTAYVNIESDPSQIVWLDFHNNVEEILPAKSLSEPTQIGSDSDWRSVYAFDRISFAIKNDGSIYGWGRNNAYVLRQSNRTITYYTPVLVDAGSSWKTLVSDGSTVFAIKSDGTLWGWGENSGGIFSTYSDEGISGAYGPSSLLTGGSFVSATNTSTRITTSAGSCTTSSISNSLLGAASLTMSETPTSTPGIYPVNDEGNWEVTLPFNIEYNGTTYSTVYVNTNSFISFGSGYVGYEFDTDTPATDKLYISAWDGYAYRIYYGQEGNTFRIRWEGDTMYDASGDSKIWEVVFYQNTPNQIDVHVGDNGNWKLPTGTQEQYPIEIVPGTTWKDISMSVYGEVQYEAGGAVKSDGTLWMWGSNDLGQLGFGDTTDRIFPTQLGTDTNWRTILRGVTKNFALKDL